MPNADIHYEIKINTDELTPMDYGLVYNLNYEYKTIDEWLWEDDNIELGDSGKISASKFRIIFTRAVGETWDKVHLKAKNHRRYFTKTGCGIALTSKENYHIQTQ